MGRTSRLEILFSTILFTSSCLIGCGEFKPAELNQTEFGHPNQKLSQPQSIRPQSIKAPLNTSTAQITIPDPNTFIVSIAAQRVAMLDSGEKVPVTFSFTMDSEDFDGEVRKNTIMAKEKELAGYVADIYFNRDLAMLVVMIADTNSDDLLYSSVATLYFKALQENGDMISIVNNDDLELFNFELIQEIGPTDSTFDTVISDIPKLLELKNLLPEGEEISEIDPQEDTPQSSVDAEKTAAINEFNTDDGATDPIASINPEIIKEQITTTTDNALENAKETVQTNNTVEASNADDIRASEEKPVIQAPAPIDYTLIDSTNAP